MVYAILTDDSKIPATNEIPIKITILPNKFDILNNPRENNKTEIPKPIMPVSQEIKVKIKYTG